MLLLDAGLDRVSKARNNLARLAPGSAWVKAGRWNQWDIINSGSVLTLILAAYVYFSG